MKIEMCDENPFKYVLQEKLLASRPVVTSPQPVQNKSGSKALKIILWTLLVLLIIIGLGIAIWSLWVSYSTRSKIKEFRSIPGPPGPAGPVGQSGSQGPMGPQGPPGTFFFVGLGVVSGIFANGCVKVPTENRILIPSSDNGYLIFDRRLPESGKLSDQLGNILIGQDGVYVMYVSLQLNMGDTSKPVVVRVYRNNIMFGYYEYTQSGSQTFTVVNDYKKGDEIRIAIITDSENNMLITHGSFVSVLMS